jgi:cytochrome c-type biogenesis protein CcmH/NrfG
MIDVEKLIKDLEEAVQCDPDHGDPWMCLSCVDEIINNLKKGNKYER